MNLRSRLDRTVEYQRSLLRAVGMVFLLGTTQPLAAQIPELQDEWRWVRFDLYSGLESPNILNIVELASGVPWVQMRSGLAWYDGYRWQDVPLDSAESAGISRGRVSADSDGVLLVISPNVYRVTLRGATRLAPSVNGAPLAVQRAFSLPNFGIVLQGDTALYLYRRDTTVLLPSPYQHAQVRADHPFGLYQTTNGVLWLNAPQGLFRWVGNGWRLWFAPATGEQMSVYSIVESARGVGALSARLNVTQISVEWVGDATTRSEITDPSTAVTTAEISPGGTIIAQLTSGVLSLYAGGGWHPVNPHPRVLFKDPVQQGSSSVISWQVEAPWELVPSSDVKVRYRVDDRSWSEWSGRRTVTLTGLAIGSHTFTVQSKGIIGQVSRAPQSLTFEVQPALILRPVFYIPVGVLLAAVAILVYVSIRRKGEFDRTMREQDARFRAVVEQQTELIVRLLPEGKLSFVNEAFCRLLQQKRDALIGQHIRSVLDHDGGLESFDLLLHVAPGARPVEIDRLVRTASGEERWLRWTSTAIPGDSGAVGEIQIIGRDITERKAAEENLVRSEERYRIVAEQTGQLVYDYDIPSGAITWSGAIREVTGFSAEEFRALTVHEWERMIHEEDRVAAMLELDRSMASGRQYRVTYRFRHKTGAYIDIFDNGIFLPDSGGQSVRMLGTMTDITERRRTEAQIAASLEEKEVLLKEIHHRVKNNLQVISSLLNLQAASVVDTQTLEQLRESQNRIRSMALIHERLYQSGNLARIDFGEYARSLVGFLARSYNVPGVQVQVDVQNIELPVNAAIPCGLVINELVSNALKYAFPNKRGGVVVVGLKVTSDRTAVLSVRDDGIGLPHELDHQNTTTLGLQLVNTLTKQLNGTIGLMRDRGTTFSITFRVEA